MRTISWPTTRVLVTGGAGFLGRHVVEELRRRGTREIFVPRSRDYDLVEREACRRVLTDSRPDVLFHLAARVGGIGANRRAPGSMLFENAIMGLQLLEEARLARVAKTVIVGSICAYPKCTPVPFREEDLWNGYPEETNAPYGVAKRLLLVQSQAYRRQYGLESIMLFPVNLYGPGDNFDPEDSHVIPAIVRQCVLGKEEGRAEIRLWGDGSPTREFLHVRDAAVALVLAAERYESSEPVNIGSGHEISIHDLARLIAAITGYQGSFVFDCTQPNGQPRRRTDPTRARELFGFVAKTPFEEGLKQTVEWYLAHR